MPKTFKAIKYTDTQLEELAVNELVFPYSDSELEYDGLTHTYIPTIKAFTKRGVDIVQELKDRNISDVGSFMKQVSFKFYMYAFKKSATNGQLKIKYLIAKRGMIKNYGNMYEYRNAIIQAMVYLGEYLAVNGDLSQISGVDLNENLSVDINTLRNEERDYPNGFRQLMANLGLCYVGEYYFNISGLGTEW